MFQKFSKVTFILFLIIFIEGYVVLASEILAIRLITSYVGNGVSTVSVIIAAVLLPLSFGYYAGGQFRAGLKGHSVREKLTSNIFVALCFLVPALSTFIIEAFFVTAFQEGISDLVLLASFYSAVFLVVPVFLLGQTIPLISNYFSAEKLSRVTATVLFVSTAGSFIGSIFTTMIMMRYFGVNDAANLVVLMLGALVLLLSKKIMQRRTMVAIGLVIFMLLINSDAALRIMGIAYNNEYNTVSVLNRDGGKVLSINGSFSSFLGDDGKKFPYVEYIEKHYIQPVAENKGQDKKNILIIGAAGFTMGSDDQYNDYTYVDIDPDLQKAAEEKFLGKPLTANKTFIGQDAIAYLSSHEQKFDLIVLDAYTSRVYIPEQLLTQEFFLKIKNALSEKGIIVANLIMSPNFADNFSRRVDNSFRSVFPNYGRQVLPEGFNGWSDNPHIATNVIYSYRDGTADDRQIYTNNHNTSSFDKLGTKYHH